MWTRLTATTLAQIPKGELVLIRFFHEVNNPSWYDIGLATYDGQDGFIIDGSCIAAAIVSHLVVIDEPRLVAMPRADMRSADDDKMLSECKNKGHRTRKASHPHFPPRQGQQCEICRYFAVDG